MDKVGNLSVAVIYILSLACTAFAMHLIRSYQKGKPPGLQTILSHAVVLLTHSTLISCFLVTLTKNISVWIVTFHGPLNHPTACLLFGIAWFGIAMLFVGPLLALIVKYLLIYHRYPIQTTPIIICNKQLLCSSLMIEVSDLEMETAYKIGCIIVPGLVMVLDLFVSNVKRVASYTFFRYNNPPSPSSHLGYAMSSLIFVAFVIIILVQSRIEFDHIMYEEEESSLFSRMKNSLKKVGSSGSNFQENVVYKMAIIRSLVGLSLVIVILVVISQTFPELFHIRDTAMAGHILTSVVYPYIFICNHGDLRKMLKKQFSLKLLR